MNIARILNHNLQLLREFKTNVAFARYKTVWKVCSCFAYIQSLTVQCEKLNQTYLSRFFFVDEISACAQIKSFNLDLESTNLYVPPCVFLRFDFRLIYILISYQLFVFFFASKVLRDSRVSHIGDIHLRDRFVHINREFCINLIQSTLDAY